MFLSIYTVCLHCLSLGYFTHASLWSLDLAKEFINFYENSKSSLDKNWIIQLEAKNSKCESSFPSSVFNAVCVKVGLFEFLVCEYTFSLSHDYNCIIYLFMYMFMA